MDGGLEAEFRIDPAMGDLRDVIEKYGEMPLPPYLKRRARAEDRLWYQTEYAEVEGSIAAPTAGLHFTLEMLREIEGRGVLVRYITLHVGKGTFMPVRTEAVSAHRMESEHFEVGEALLDEISGLKGRLVSVGTTATRAIEAVVSGRYEPAPGQQEDSISGSTDIFISPGYEPRAVDAILTNFHLPISTPLMLASVFAGRDELMRAYAIAVENSYRFFSYGDAMLIQ
jgi:S-adenosylmethionine:tRNA ribosyltransferase-isomerase